MDTKKRLTILVVIAVILAITAIVLNITDSEIPTTRSSSDADQGNGGVIGVDIIPGEIEDKLLEESGTGQP